MQKILITGSSGFVGSFLVETCLQQFPNMEVWAGVRKTSSRKYLQDNRIHFFEMDFSDTQKMTEDLRTQQFTHVIHNAGLTKADKKQDFFRVNTDYTKNFITALEKSGCPLEKFTFVSSMASYGPADNKTGGMVVESDTPRPIDTYGESKLAAERFLRSQPDLPYLIFRPTAVYGPREKDIFTFFQILNKGIEPYIGLKEQQVTFIYVKDLARLLVEATFSDVSRKSYFVADENVYSNYDLGRYGKQFLNKKSFRIKVPVSLVRGVALVNETYGKLSGKMPPLSLEKVNILESLNWKCDIRGLKRDFGFESEYDLEKGLEETIGWYRSKGWL